MLNNLETFMQDLEAARSTLSLEMRLKTWMRRDFEDEDVHDTIES